MAIERAVTGILIDHLATFHYSTSACLLCFALLLACLDGLSFAVCAFAHHAGFRRESQKWLQKRRRPANQKKRIEMAMIGAYLHSCFLRLKCATSFAVAS